MLCLQSFRGFNLHSQKIQDDFVSHSPKSRLAQKAFGNAMLLGEQYVRCDNSKCRWIMYCNKEGN